MNRAEEYTSLRQEILQNYNHIKDYRNLAYTSTIAILAFSFSDFAATEPFISLLPVLIVIPLYLLCEGCFMSISKIGSFLNVFYYDDGYTWERIQHDYEQCYTQSNRKKMKKGFMWRESSFIAIILACGIISLYKCLSIKYKMRVLMIRCIIIIITMVLSLIIIGKANINVAKERMVYIEKWLGLKRKMEKK